jgi:hypothetical protein
VSKKLRQESCPGGLAELNSWSLQHRYTHKRPEWYCEEQYVRFYSERYPARAQRRRNQSPCRTLCARSDEQTFAQSFPKCGVCSIHESPKASACMTIRFDVGPHCSYASYLTNLGAENFEPQSLLRSPVVHNSMRASCGTRSYSHNSISYKGILTPSLLCRVLFAAQGVLCTSKPVVDIALVSMSLHICGSDRATCERPLSIASCSALRSSCSRARCACSSRDICFCACSSCSSRCCNASDSAVVPVRESSYGLPKQ